MPGADSLATLMLSPSTTATASKCSWTTAKYEIYGGSDGVGSNGLHTQLHIKDCEIRFAHCRGIFSNSHLIIENSEVSNCGSYGIKDRFGRTLRGDNDIQPGPWDAAPCQVPW